MEHYYYCTPATVLGCGEQLCWPVFYGGRPSVRRSVVTLKELNQAREEEEEEGGKVWEAVAMLHSDPVAEVRHLLMVMDVYRGQGTRSQGV